MNRPDDLRRGLEAVRRCTPSPIETIVSDDSADGTATRQVVTDFPGVRYQSGPRRGLGANRNACLRDARGAYIHFIDDDVLLPSRFYAEAELLLGEDPGVLLTGNENRHSDDNVYRIQPHDADFWGFQQIPFEGAPHSIVINATLFPATLFSVALFDENLRYGCDEIDIARHALACGFRIAHTDRLCIDHYPSPINRGHYNRYVDASRLYSTAKAYWRYERKPLKTAAYLALAPAHLLGSAIKNRQWRGVWSACQATALALRYLRTKPQGVES